MATTSKPKSTTQVVVIAIILIAVLMKRFYLKTFNTDALLGLLTGIALLVVGYVVFRIISGKKTKE